MKNLFLPIILFIITLSGCYSTHQFASYNETQLYTKAHCIQQELKSLSYSHASRAQLKIAQHYSSFLKEIIDEYKCGHIVLKAAIDLVDKSYSEFASGTLKLNVKSIAQSKNEFNHIPRFKKAKRMPLDLPQEPPPS